MRLHYLFENTSESDDLFSNKEHQGGASRLNQLIVMLDPLKKRKARLVDDWMHHRSAAQESGAYDTINGRPANTPAGEQYTKERAVIWDKQQDIDNRVKQIVKEIISLLQESKMKFKTTQKFSWVYTVSVNNIPIGEIKYLTNVGGTPSTPGKNVWVYSTIFTQNISDDFTSKKAALDSMIKNITDPNSKLFK